MKRHEWISSRHLFVLLALSILVAESAETVRCQAHPQSPAFGASRLTFKPEPSAKKLTGSRNQ